MARSVRGAPRIVVRVIVAVRLESMVVEMTGKLIDAVVAIVGADVLPLVFPRVGARVRSAIGGRTRQTIESLRADTFVAMRARSADPADETVAELRRVNARLAGELRDLRSAYVQLSAEVADRFAATNRLNYLAYHDALTTLPNRMLLMERLAQALTSARRAGSDVLVMFLDLDHFKSVNDVMGHAAGDRVLSQIALRIAACMRDTDTASRVGGDEFVLICPANDSAADRTRIVDRLRTAIGLPIDIDGTAVRIGVSIGTSAFPADGTDAAELIAAADRAMYLNKLSHRG